MGKVLHASKSGYFPSCIQTATSPDHCPWTLQNAMDTYWRVRTWRFTVSGLAGPAGDEPTIPISETISNISSGNFEDATNYNSEEQLVCSNSFFFNTVDDDIFSYIGFGNPEKSDDLYNSGISGYFQNIETFGLVCEFRTYPVYPPFEPDVNNSGTITVLGATLPLLIYYLDEQETITFADVVATLTPTLWWSYGGTYDTATGNPL